MDNIDEEDYSSPISSNGSDEDSNGLDKTDTEHKRPIPKLNKASKSFSRMFTPRKEESGLEYHPLCLIKTTTQGGRKAETKVDFKLHVGDPDCNDSEMSSFEDIPRESIISKQINQTKLAVCLTMYNEPYSQILESLAGVYRNYYELVGKDKDYEGKATVVIVCDGYAAFNKIGIDDKSDYTFADRLEYSGLYDRSKTSKYVSKVQVNKNQGRDPSAKVRTQQEYKVNYSDLGFMNELKNARGSQQEICFETHNLAHCFSRKMTFTDFMEGLNETEKQEFMIDKYEVYNFLLGNSEQGKVKEQIYEHLPLDIHFVIKHKNRGKIESHLWFFKGFCKALQPEFCFIIDAGTIALWESISKIIFYMECFKNIGGASGEIEVMLPEKNDDGTAISFFQSILLRAQYVEYKLSHYVDKAAESLFGFVSVLPGAFSAFRWKAIEGEPLEKFLLGQKLTDSRLDTYPNCGMANMYLAEDRIMCLEIIAKEEENYILEYIPGCKALTDAPNFLTQLIKQRRRWFNGSMFASFHVLKNMCRTWRRADSFFRNIGYMILYLYMLINMFVGYLIVGLFYASYSIFLRSVFRSDDCLSVSHAANVLENVYLTFLFFCLILSTSVRVEWAEIHFRVCCFFMGIFTLLMIASMGLYYDEGAIASYGVLFIIILVSVYVVPLFLHAKKLKAADFIRGIVYLLFMTPTYINIMAVYAVSNIHDVSWGSRPVGTNAGAASVREMAMSIDYQNYRSRFLIIWIVINNAAGFVVVAISRSSQTFYLMVIGAVLMTLIGLKFLFSLLHVLQAWISDCQLNSYMKNNKIGRKFDVVDSPEERRLLAEFTPLEYKRIADKKVKRVIDDEEDHQIVVEENIFVKATRQISESNLNIPKFRNRKPLPYIDHSKHRPKVEERKGYGEESKEAGSIHDRDFISKHISESSNESDNSVESTQRREEPKRENNYMHTTEPDNKNYLSKDVVDKMVSKDLSLDSESDHPNQRRGHESDSDRKSSKSNIKKFPTMRNNGKQPRKIGKEGSDPSFDNILSEDPISDSD